MSAFISARLPDSVQLLADGAVYDNDGIVIDFVSKISAAKTVPVAISSRGNRQTAMTLASLLCEMADRRGISELIKALSSVETNLDTRRYFKGNQDDMFDLAIALWHPEEGPSHYRLASADGIPGIVPFKLYKNPGMLFACGSAFEPQLLYQLGILPVMTDGPTWGATKAGEIMDLMRGLKGPNLPGFECAHAYRIGGHVDVASVTSSGVQMRRIRQYNDKLGELINPFRQEVKQIGNRRERRAAKRRAA